jgi:hypothetical protein
MEKKSRAELLGLCKEKSLCGYSSKNKSELIQLLQSSQQDTGKFRENNRDQFYTAPAVAKSCVQAICETVPDVQKFLWIEPAAGTGSFLNEVPVGLRKIGIDIDPKGKGIKHADFLTWVPPQAHHTLVFGNPPFGKQSSTAKAFVKRSCKFAEVVALDVYVNKSSACPTWRLGLARARCAERCLLLPSRHGSYDSYHFRLHVLMQVYIA